MSNYHIFIDLFLKYGSFMISHDSYYAYLISTPMTFKNISIIFRSKGGANLKNPQNSIQYYIFKISI